jgi:agmatinase
MTPLDELAVLLRPAGGGVHLVSSGKHEQALLQEKLYGVTGVDAVEAAFRSRLSQIAQARGVMLGIPSDVGAGYRRGANLGPQEIRLALLGDEGKWKSLCDAGGLLDLGDVFVVPQLLHDEMLNPEQKTATAQVLYPQVSRWEQASLPVSPLSIAERAWNLVLELNPAAKIFALGGDHSTAGPGVAALAKVHRESWGIVQPDAHTDLLVDRLGIKHCFATWSYHANDLLGRNGRLVQVGVRASGHTQQHWESTLGVRQFWAKDILADPEGALKEIVAALRGAGVKSVYFSNDIDGTDAAFAPATGTPEGGGLTPDWVVQLVRVLGREVGLLGGDVMEVAPPLGPTPEAARATVALAARYFKETCAAALGVGL